MGRSPCCDKVGLKKGPWTPEEDQKLMAYIEEHGHGSWRSLPTKAGLQRCGKSCRLRWTNYLRPDIKRGKFSLQEEQTIIQLHALLGNRWSAIATHLPKRTDNEIKNYWNTHLKKRLAKMGIDPVTHKPKNEALPSSVDGQYKSAAKLSHMAQWESARLEAEARLVRESKLLRSHSFSQGCSSSASGFSPASTFMAPGQILGSKISGDNLESPTSILTFSESIPPVMSAANTAENPKKQTIEFVGSSDQQGGGNIIKEEGHYQTIEFVLMQQEAEGLGFTELLLDSSGEQSLSEGGNGGAGDSDNGGENGGRTDHHEDNKNYWNSILNLVNSSPAGSPLF